jgi:hypothetical protein
MVVGIMQGLLLLLSPSLPYVVRRTWCATVYSVIRCSAYCMLNTFISSELIPPLV